MKIVLATDGSAHAQAAVDVLKRLPFPPRSDLFNFLSVLGLAGTMRAMSVAPQHLPAGRGVRSDLLSSENGLAAGPLGGYRPDPAGTLPVGSRRPRLVSSRRQPACRLQRRYTYTETAGGSLYGIPHATRGQLR